MQLVYFPLFVNSPHGLSQPLRTISPWPNVLNPDLGFSHVVGTTLRRLWFSWCQCFLFLNNSDSTINQFIHQRSFSNICWKVRVFWKISRWDGLNTTMFLLMNQEVDHTIRHTIQPSVQLIMNVCRHWPPPNNHHDEWNDLTFLNEAITLENEDFHWWAFLCWRAKWTSWVVLTLISWNIQTKLRIPVTLNPPTSPSAATSRRV